MAIGLFIGSKLYKFKLIYNAFKVFKDYVIQIHSAMSKSTKVAKKSKKDLKSDQRDLFKSLVPIFKLKLGNLGNRVLCKLQGYVQDGEKIQDDPVDSIDDKRTETFGMYDISYMTTQCNISGSYLVKNDKLPIMCKSVMYNRKFLSGNLFSCFLYFTLDNATREMLTDPSKYNDRMMSGEFTLELLTIDDDFLETFLKYKRGILENQLMESLFDAFDAANDDEKENIMTNIQNTVTEKLEVYKKYFEPITIESPKKHKIVAAMDGLFANSHMTELIDFGLKFRDKKRIDESCPDQTFEVPKKIINSKDLKDDPDNIDEKLDKLLENCSDSDYSDN